MVTLLQSAPEAADIALAVSEIDALKLSETKLSRSLEEMFLSWLSDVIVVGITVADTYACSSGERAKRL